MSDTKTKRALRVLLSDRPIAYHPVLAKITGGIKAGILLGQLLYCDSVFVMVKGKAWGGWFYKTDEELMQETGLTLRELESARTKLRDAKLVQTDRRSVPAKMHYHVELDVIENALGNLSSAESAELDMRKTHNKLSENGGTITETTPKTPPETTVSESQRLGVAPTTAAPIGGEPGGAIPTGDFYSDGKVKGVSHNPDGSPMSEDIPMQDDEPEYVDPDDPWGDGNPKVQPKWRIPPDHPELKRLMAILGLKYFPDKECRAKWKTVGQGLIAGTVAAAWVTRCIDWADQKEGKIKMRSVLNFMLNTDKMREWENSGGNPAVVLPGDHKQPAIVLPPGYSA